MTTSVIKKSHLEGAFACVKAMVEQAGVDPDVITYNALISACEKAGKVERALEIFEGMRAAGIIPNVITYSALISACEKAGKVKTALKFFDGMRAAGIIPNVITYSALISACEKAGQAELALKIFDDMRAAGIIPNVITYNALISACVRGGHSADARRLLKEAVSDDVFHPSLGYDKGANSLDFHLNSLLVTSPVGGRAGGVSADMAQVLFDHHLDLGNLSCTTKFVVGQHGDDVIKDAIAQRMLTKGWTAVQGFSHGKVNSGRLVVAQSPAQTASIASTLSAAAKEFVPPGQTAPNASTLNAAAKAFVPSGPPRR
ncbi:MAG: hypothetical protein JF606_17460 [Burkholderiales bacterium]|nr:hypothetical protein [Burkholderiales bacterium]